MSDGIDSYRSEIDDIDEQIMTLLAKRQAVVLKIAHYKAQQGMTAMQPDRHQAVALERQERAIRHGLNPSMVITIWRSIMNEAVRIQEEALRDK